MNTLKLSTLLLVLLTAGLCAKIKPEDKEKVIETLVSFEWKFKKQMLSFDADGKVKGSTTDISTYEFKVEDDKLYIHLVGKNGGYYNMQVKGSTKSPQIAHDKNKSIKMYKKRRIKKTKKAQK